MSSRRGSGGPQPARQFQRGGLRDNNRNSQGQSTNQPTLTQSRSTRNTRGKQHHDGIPGESRNLQQLRRILLDEDDLARRNASAIQLIRTIEESRHNADPALQHECLQLIDVCLFKQQQNVRSIFECMRPPSNTLKNSMIKLISILGCYCGRLDIVLVWIFEHLQRWISSDGPPAEVNRTKEFKLWLLRMLRQSIADAASDPYIKCQLYDLSSNITSSMIMFLDAMDTPDYLPEVLQVLDVLAASCRTTFSEKFQDVIDLLVGWHIDTGLSEHRRGLIREIYKKFRPFWQTRLSFAFELLQHFLNDMQSIVASIMVDGSAEERQSKWDTCESLFSCFHAMVHAVVPLLPTPEVRKDIHVIGPIFDLLRPNVLSFLCHVKELSPRDTWIEKSNQVLLLLFTMNPQGARLYQRQVYEYFASQMVGNPSINPHVYLKALMKLIDVWGTLCDATILQDLLDIDSSPLYYLRAFNRGDKQLNSGILVILRTLVRMDGIADIRQSACNGFARSLVEKLAVITSAYDTVPKENTCVLKGTSQEIESHTELVVKKSDPNTLVDKPSWLQVTDAVVDALFFSYLLLDVAAAWPVSRKHHILLVLDTLNTAWECKCTDVFDAGIQILTEFCSRCSYLVKDAHDFKLIATLVQDVCMNWSVTNLRTRQMICDFVRGVLQTFSSEKNQHHEVSTVVQNIIKSLLGAFEYERTNTIKEEILKIVADYCKQFSSIDLMQDALSCIQVGLDDPHSEIRTASAELLSVLNPFLTADIDIEGDTTTRLLETAVMATPHTGAFRPTHYEIVMAHLGMSEHLIGSAHSENNRHLSTFEEDGQFEWARRLFHHCAASSSIQNSNTSADIKNDVRTRNHMNSSREFLNYWVIWEASRYCMLARLRTPFGGPQQTLAAFERMLASLVSVDIEKLRDDSITRENLTNLLLLLDRLEIQIHNASNGCATNALPAVPRSSLAFFRTNKKTCKEYFARIRPAMIQGAKMLHDDGLLIRNALEMLHEREAALHDKESLDPHAWFSELNKLLCDLVSACIRVTASDLIHGIQSWYKRVIRKVSHTHPSFSKEWVFEGLVGPINTQDISADPSCPVTWFQVGAQFAIGRHENAIRSLELLHSHIGRDEYGIMDMLDNQALDFYTCIEDYDALKRLYDANGSMFSKILSRELIVFADSEDPSQVQPTCDLSDFYSSLRDLGVTECMQLGRLMRFRDWLSGDDQSEHIQVEINRLLSDRARLSLEGGVFSERTSMIETQLLQPYRLSTLNSINDYFPSLSNSVNTGKNVLETAHWGRLSNYVERMATTNDELGAVRLHAARVARKQGNLRIASSWLERVSSGNDRRFHALYEKAKVLLLTQDTSSQLAAMETLNSIITGMETKDDGDKKLYSKACLEVARLLKTTYGDNDNPLLAKLDPEFIKADGIDSVSNLQSSAEIAIDIILKKSVENASLFRKPWFEYATYHYKQGWRILDDLPRSEPGMPIVLWARRKFREILGQEHMGVERELCGLLQKHSGTVGEKALAKSVSLKNAVQQLLVSSSDKQIPEILGAMETVHKNIIETFQTSVTAYFQYLSLGENYNENEKRSTSMVMTATLRLLRMLVKYSDALQSVFFGNIEQVSIEPWKKIIPQLFARLNHPSSVVQKVIGQLLDRICDEYPREIIYDIIVSSSSSKTNRESKAVLNTIANRMMERNEILWLSTQRMAEELEKITVLWEEKWSYKISSLALNAIEQFTKLDQEIVRLESSHKDGQIDKPFFESYDNVMKFIISSIDKLLNATILASTQKTPHEQWFIDSFGTRILQAFEVLQKPKDMATFRDGWDMFIQINRALMFETHKVRMLELQDVSPYLASIRSSTIGIPGMSSNDDCPVFIDSFGSNVVVLPTKTKPKKLDLRGTDGKKYSYLFKGLEDLHLDERVMQLLSTVNGLLREDTAAVARDLKTRTYAVIPLSDHSGMIQWVNDATPLFALYKRWQRREQTAKILLSNDKATAEDYNQPPQRPTEMFTSKIEAALKAEGLRVTTNRRHWPKRILKKVYLELVKETPGDLLAKEIWCSSSDPTEWLRKSTSLTRSLAVMSVIGYIIGLGDRHLDNILIDYQSGEVIHIDYNVCFEKGRQLRVPELVPFRLTQNMLNALGVTGTDGIFRIAAEETLRVLRKHKEVLMTLLDAFVYDPLVHWATEAEELEERQIMELQINLGLVAKRLGEKKSEYDGHEHDVLKGLSAVTDKLKVTQQASLQELQLQAIDIGSDDEVDSESYADHAKKNIQAIAQDCSIWASKHNNALASLVKDTFIESLYNESFLSDTIFTNASLPSQNSKAREVYQVFSKALSTWITQRDSFYKHSAEEMLAYKQLVYPVARKLLTQDCCCIWPSLQELIAESFTKSKVEEVWSRLQQGHFSQFMQNLESCVFTCANSIQQALSRIDRATKQVNIKDPSKIYTELITLSKRNTTAAVTEWHDSLMIVESAIRKLDSDDQEYASASISTESNVDLTSLLPPDLQSLEHQCHIECFGQGSYANGLLSLAAYFQCHVDAIQHLGVGLNATDKVAVQAVLPCARALYMLENECLSLCRTIFQGLIADGDRLKGEMVQLQGAINDQTVEILIDSKPNANDKTLLGVLQKPFESLDRFCNSVKKVLTDMDTVDVEAATEHYVRLKRKAIVCLLRESFKHIESIPTQGWTTAMISSWSITYNTSIGQCIKDLCTGFISSVFISFTTSLIRMVRNQLLDAVESNQPVSNSKMSYGNYLHQFCIATATEYILKTINPVRSKFASSLDKYQVDIARFHWYNAPYIQTRRPLLPESLLAQMATTPERLQALGRALQGLSEMYTNLTKDVPQLSATQNAWQSAYSKEVAKLSTIMDLYTSVNHMESCREGFTQAMIIGKEIGDNLEPFMVDEISEGATNNVDDNSIYVSPEILREVQKEIHRMCKIISMIKSPVDGIVPLLESIAVIEVETDNDLSPAQQSAKAVLDSLSAISATVSKLNEGEKDWSYSRLNDCVDSFAAKVQELFASLRTLEEFGADRPEESREQPSTAATHDVAANEVFPEQSSPLQVLNEEHKATVGQNAKQNSTFVIRSSQDHHQNHGVQQQRDMQVLNIMRRIQSKLEGRDFGSQHKLSVAEQVSKAVDQAVSVDNLCAMYEGWTSWV
ncbi:hypothetical protein BJV82DRAFT_537101 [Fennellomyces sp. T-0311]|nr:hypothetical protein BJV82DRAFT_537101 [Fennellomyces sp. T-0311]